MNHRLATLAIVAISTAAGAGSLKLIGSMTDNPPAPTASVSASTAVPEPDPTSTANWPLDKVVSAVNQVRADNGVDPLLENTLLDLSASMKAKELCTDNVWSHVGADGHHGYEMIADVGYAYTYAGENLFYDSAGTTIATAVDAWVKSPKHFEAMTNPIYIDTGVGVTRCAKFQGRPNAVIIVQHFGSTV